VLIASTTARGLLCGIGAALFWAFGFVAARHGVTVGMSPLLIAVHRFVWPGLLFLVVVARDGFADLRILGWWRAIVLTLFGGVPLALLSYAGFLFVPLGDGGIIQPSCAAVGGLILASVVLKEPLPARRVAGALAIIIGLCVIGVQALKSMGAHGVIGDLLFVAAGCSFAVFAMLLRLWNVEPLRATAVTTILSLAALPAVFFQFHDLVRVGLVENLLQIVVQGVFAGAGAIYLFTRGVVLLGASRAALFPALVPPFTLLVGFLAIGEVPSLAQLVGLAIVVLGFRLTQQDGASVTPPLR
jgi:drug/metabolite transporter (DMT)-like permease